MPSVGCSILPGLSVAHVISCEHCSVLEGSLEMGRMTSLLFCLKRTAGTEQRRIALDHGQGKSKSNLYNHFLTQNREAKKRSSSLMVSDYSEFMCHH